MFGVWVSCVFVLSVLFVVVARVFGVGCVGFGLGCLLCFPLCLYIVWLFVGLGGLGFFAVYCSVLLFPPPFLFLSLCVLAWFSPPLRPCLFCFAFFGSLFLFCGWWVGLCSFCFIVCVLYSWFWGFCFVFGLWSVCFDGCGGFILVASLCWWLLFIVCFFFVVVVCGGLFVFYWLFAGRLFPLVWLLFFDLCAGCVLVEPGSCLFWLGLFLFLGLGAAASVVCLCLV